MVLQKCDYNLKLEDICKKYGVSLHKAQLMRAEAGIFRYFNVHDHSREEMLNALSILSKKEFMSEYKIQSAEFSSILSYYKIDFRAVRKMLLDEDVQRVLDLVGPEAFNKFTYEKYGKYSYTSILNTYGGMRALYEVFGIEKHSFQEDFLRYFENVSGIKLQREVCFDTCINPKTGMKLRFDGYSSDPQFLLEVDDISHFVPMYGDEESFNAARERDKIKDEWANVNHIKLFRFSSISNWKNHVLSILDELDLLPSGEHIIEPCSSGYMGVSWLNGKWNVRVCFGKGEVIHLGSYDTALYGAIIREKYLIEANNVISKRNDLTLEDLKQCGFSSWDDVPFVDKQKIQSSMLENFNACEKQKSDPVLKKHYIGVKKLRDTFSTVINVNGKCVQLGVFDSEKKAAIYREGYIIENGLRHRKNGFTLDDLQEFGIFKWEDYKLLKRKKMRGVYFSEFYNVWGFKVVLSTEEFKGQYSVLGFDSELAAAVYRERVLQHFVTPGKEKLNFITPSELASLGFMSWEDVPIYNLITRSFDMEVPHYRFISFQNQYFS